jgi:hypothetical protein
MTSVAVVAHRKKTLGGGLPELHRLLNDRGVDQPLWYEVPKSRKAPAQGIPTDLEQAVRIALDGDRRTLDLKLRVRIAPGAVTVCVPHGDGPP